MSRIVAFVVAIALVACDDPRALGPRDATSGRDGGAVDTGTQSDGDGSVDAADANAADANAADAGDPAACFRDVAVGDDFACAVRADGTAFCWGANRFGQLGDGTTSPHVAPLPVLGSAGRRLAGVVEIAAGSGFACARLEDSHVRCWGTNTSGQLGPGATAPVGVPVPFLDSAGAPEVDDALHVAVGPSYTCVSRANGEVSCAGLNNAGQLGDGTDEDRNLPVRVLEASSGTPVRGIEDLEPGAFHSCALRSPGVSCWGRAGFGRLGIGATADVPSAAVAPSLDDLAADPVVDVSTGFGHSCALRASGALECWGELEDPMIFGGIGSILVSEVPVAVPGPSGGVALARGSDASHVCVITASRELHCMGSNRSGQLGDGTMTGRATFAPVRTAGGAPLTRVIAASHSQLTTCAILEVDTVWCWGRGDEGQLGMAGGASSPMPVRVDVPCEG